MWGGNTLLKHKKNRTLSFFGEILKTIVKIDTCSRNLPAKIACLRMQV